MTDDTRILPRLTADRVDVAARAVASAFQVAQHDILHSRGRQAQLAAARMALYRLLYEHTSATVVAVGAFVDRDHTTILHGMEQTRRWPETKPAYAAAYRIAEQAVTR